MGDSKRDEERREESRRILERVDRDSDSLTARPASGVRDHSSKREEKDSDWTEQWGRRIGRSLSLVFAVILIFWLWSFLTGEGAQ